MRNHIWSNDRSTGIKRENVSYKRFFVTLTNHHIGNLDNWILVWLWKYSFSTSTFDVITKNTKWSNICPFSFWSMWNEFFPSNVYLDLTTRWLDIKIDSTAAKIWMTLFSDLVLVNGQFNPVTSDNISVGHETNFKIDIGFKCTISGIRKIGNVDFAFFQQPFGRSNQSWNWHHYLDVWFLGIALKSINGGFF